MKTKIELSKKALAVIAVGFLMAGCSKGASETAEKKAAQHTAAGRKAVRVKAQAIEPRTFVQKIKLVAAAKAYKEVVIGAELPGRVVKIGFEKGDLIKEGQPLVWLDDRQARADIAQAGADRDLAALDYRKLKALADKKADVSEFALDQARLRLAAADARMQGLDVMLDKLTIRAPFSGLMASRGVELGAMVSPGQPLARLATLNPIKLSTGIPETAISDFSLGKEASIVFDSYPSKERKGKITYLAPEVDQRTRTFECELELANPDRKIKPEMSAKVTFVRKEMKDSILIPQEAVLELSDGHAVFVVENGVARQKKVKIEDMADEMAQVSSGVSVGDMLVTLGQRGLIDGDRVVVSE